MITAGPPGRGESGFTLVELMVAIFIFAVVISIVFVSMDRMETSGTAGLSSVRATAGAVSVTNTLVPQLQDAVYPTSSDLSSASQGTLIPLNSPVVVACPEEVLFFASPPSGTASPAPPEWFWAFLIPTPGAAGPLAAQSYTVEELEFQPGHGYANTIFQSDGTCPASAPSSGLIGAVKGAPGGRLPIDTSGIYMDLSASAGGYNGTTGSSGTPESQLFTYLNGSTGLKCPANQAGGCSYAPNDVAAVGINVTVKRRPLSPVGVDDYRVLLTAVGNQYCLPYADFNPEVCSTS